MTFNSTKHVAKRLRWSLRYSVVGICHRISSCAPTYIIPHNAAIAIVPTPVMRYVPWAAEVVAFDPGRTESITIRVECKKTHVRIYVHVK